MPGSDPGHWVPEPVFLPIAAIWLSAASECPGQGAADGRKPGMLDGRARGARAELRADRRREVGVDQRVGHVPDSQWSEAGWCGDLVEPAGLTPGGGAPLGGRV